MELSSDEKYTIERDHVGKIVKEAAKTLSFEDVSKIYVNMSLMRGCQGQNTNRPRPNGTQNGSKSLIGAANECVAAVNGWVC